MHRRPTYYSMDCYFDPGEKEKVRKRVVMNDYEDSRQVGIYANISLLLTTSASRCPCEQRSSPWKGKWYGFH
ncbi:hypothetical protein V5799_014420 [Amblyomma americanum]|uniref:Uncharacterized protein n=1 Tax=Amblyomma americanum TaxID=6943 RepID=A0AAQ4E344_AMBAM